MGRVFASIFEQNLFGNCALGTLSFSGMQRAAYLCLLTAAVASATYKNALQHLVITPGFSSLPTTDQILLVEVMTASFTCNMTSFIDTVAGRDNVFAALSRLPSTSNAKIQSTIT